MRLIKLKEIANFSYHKSKIMTTHYNGDKMISITAKIKENKTTSANVINLVRNKFIDIEQKYPGVYLKFAGEAEKTEETLGDLVITFVVAVLLIYFVLILLFKSVGEPLIIMVTIPFGIIGSLLAFVTHNVSFTFLGIIGIIGLTGVVVNDSIVMVDFIKKSFNTRKKNINTIITIADGAKRRLRPVLMTTLTTVAGLLPTAYGIGGYNGMLVPITLAISYGILFASLLTLFFIPSLYLVRLDIIKFVKVLFKK
jgi:multidrug efflux pump subunit AcrB